MKLRPRLPVGLAVLALFIGLGGCSDGTGPEGTGRLSLSVAASPTVPMAAAGPARVVTQDDGTNTLVLTRVAVTLREIELERASADDCEDSAGTDSDDCEEFEVGPVLLELPLDQAVSHVVSIDVPADTYDEIEFDIHKAEQPEDSAFLRMHPDFEGVSIRVEGTFNGVSFVFLQDLDEEQEIELAEPLVITEDAAPMNLTLKMDVSTWFTTSGGTLVDPASANHGGPNEGLVESNIKRSIEVFEDDDEDGERDH